MKLTLRKSDAMDDWWVIERAEHDGRTWLQKVGPSAMELRASSRFSDADVEGAGIEMRGVALAIQTRGSFRAKRCAVEVRGDLVAFSSPRNSREDGIVSLAEADELALLILATVPESPSP